MKFIEYEVIKTKKRYNFRLVLTSAILSLGSSLTSQIISNKIKTVVEDITDMK